MAGDLYAKITLGALPRNLASGRGKSAVRVAQQAAIDAGGPYVQRQLARNTPRGATGSLAQHAYFDRSSFAGEPAGFVGYRGAPSLYAAFPDQGTRPHWPPKAPIAYYVARKMGLPLGSAANERATYFVRKKIAARGTKAQHFVKETADETRRGAQGLMGRAAIRAFRQELGR